MKIFGRKGRGEAASRPSFPIDVACAIIRQGGKILITRRRDGDHLGGLWEFPGGKRMAPESLRACLERELLEELGLRVRPVRFLKRIDYRYPEKSVSLYFYACEILEGNPWPRGCQAFRWVRPFELRNYSFPPADEPILKEIGRTF
jgi:mutator protein MutT